MVRASRTRIVDIPLRYGIVSDIHSNLDALQRVLAELDEAGIDRLICLGDVVGYGPNPNECCELLRRRECIAIIGNHDEAAATEVGTEQFNNLAAQAIDWTRSELTHSNRAYLSDLPREHVFDDFAIVHGSPAAEFDYILSLADARRAFDHARKSLTFVGHSHIAEVYVLDGDGRAYHRRLPRGGRIEIAPDLKYIVNPGSVGQPRDRNPQAAFGLYDGERKVVEVRRIDYDVPSVQKRMEAVRLPHPLSARLEVGY